VDGSYREHFTKSTRRQNLNLPVFDSWGGRGKKGLHESERLLLHRKGGNRTKRYQTKRMKMGKGVKLVQKKVLRRGESSEHRRQTTNRTKNFSNGKTVGHEGGTGL